MKRKLFFCRSILIITLFIAFSTPLFSQNSNLQNFENDIKQILGNVEKSVVSVSVVNTHIKSGSKEEIQQQNWINGVVYKDTYILLKDHNLTSHSKITAMFSDGKTDQAEFVGCDDISGLSVIKCPDTDYSSELSFFEEQPKIGPGNWIIYIGNSLGVSPAIALGMVNCIRGDGMLQITSKIPAGSYGGPIFNSSGQLVGLLSIHLSNFSFEENALQSFSMEETILVDPIKTIVQIADDIILKANQPWLGIGADNWPGHVGGVHIRQIMPDSPASAADLQIGDIILGVDGTNWSQAKDMA